MKKMVKKALGLTALSFLAAWALFFMGGGQALAAEEPIEIKDDEFVLEILPEIFISRKTNDVFGSSKETIGERRSLDVFGSFPGSIDENVINAWKNVAFNIYDENGTLLRTDKGIFNGSANLKFKGGIIKSETSRWSGAKYIFGLKKDQKYTITVDKDSLPKDYYSFFTPLTSGMKDVPGPTGIRNAYEEALQVKTNGTNGGNEGTVATYEGKGTKPFVFIWML